MVWGRFNAGSARAAAGEVRAISNDTLQSEDATGAPVKSSGFLGAPTTLAPGVIESNEPAPAPAPVVAAPAAQPAPVTAPAATQTAAPATASGSYVVQVGAVSDRTRAEQYQQRLSKQFGVPAALSKTVRYGVSRWVRLPANRRQHPCNSVCRARRSSSRLSLLQNNYSVVSEMSVCVNHVNTLMMKVGCLPV